MADCGFGARQAGDAVAVTQATNNNSSFGFAVQRPNRIADPNEFAGRSVGRYFDTAAFTGAPQFVIGASSRNPVRGPGLQNADLMIGKTFPLGAQTSNSGLKLLMCRTRRR